MSHISKGERGQPLTQYRTNTEAAARSDFVDGELASHPQFEEDAVATFVEQALKTDPQSPNAVSSTARNCRGSIP